MTVVILIATLVGCLFAALRSLKPVLNAPHSGLFYAFNDSITVEALQNKLISLNESMKAAQAKADAEARELTDEEVREIDKMQAAFDATKVEIARRDRMAQNDSEVAGAAQALATARVSLGLDTRAAEVAAAANVAPQRSVTQSRIEVIPSANRGAWGWRSMGEFASAVRRAAAPGGNGNLDPRLTANALTTFSQEGVGSDGGFAVPPDFRQAIMTKVMGEASLISRTDQQITSGNQLVIPKDETTPWQTSGGIQAYWENEAGQKQQSRLALQQTSVRLNKLISLVPVTDELLEDANSLANYINSKAPEKMNFRVNDAILNGTGAGQPLGMLNSSAMVTVNPESGQAADSIRFENIVNMWARLYSGCRQNAVWLVNQDIEPQLLGMQFPGVGTAVPVYLPPGGLSAQPYGTLMGRPVIPTEACKTLGDKGDIILADLRTYLSVVKAGGVRSDISMHLWFDYDITAFRFVLRVGGQPWWTAPIDPNNGSNTRGCFVTLGERS